MQNKTLLAKIVGLVAVMCLALAMVFGLVGCGGKTVSKTSIENGHLIVTYSDNTTEDLGSVIGPKGDKGDQGEQGATGEVHDCAHENYALMGGRITLEEYNEMAVEDSELATGEDFCYLELAICKDCKYVILIPHTDHDYGAEEVVAPTCTEEGYTGKVCQVCGYAVDKYDIVDALGHDWVVKPVTQYWTEELGNFCEDGGFVLTQCNRPGCNAIADYRVVDALGHQSLNWNMTVKPTMETEGLLVGDCEICGRVNATRVLPKLDKEGTDYEYELNNENRSKEDNDFDNYVYTITIYFEEYAFVDGELVKTVRVDEETGEEISQTFTIDDLQPHMTNGKNYAGDSYIENYTENMDGIKLFANSDEELNCETFVKAYFICTECHASVLVYVKAPHTAPTAEDAWTIAVGPTCTTKGVKEAHCTECDAVLTEEIDALGHDYVPELQQIQDSEKFNIVMTCSRCQDQTTIEDVLVEKEEEPATCTKAGYIKYTYVKEEGAEPVVLEFPIAMKGHTLGGEEIDLTKTYTYGEKNFTDLVNQPVGCGETGKQYFICEGCGGSFEVKVIKPHVAPEDFKPSCDEEADNTYICTRCQAEVEVDAPEHEYFVYEKGEVNEGTVEYIVICCKNCESYYEEYEDVPYAEQTIKPATCEETGTKKISITIEEGVFEFDEDIDKCAHSFNGEDIDEVNAYPLTFEGLTPLVNRPENCQGEGVGYIVCTVCGGSVAVHVKGPHKPIEDTIVEHPATCDEKGYIEYTCELCGQEGCKDYTTAALGHKYDYEITVYPTYYVEGKVVVTCDNNCGFEQVCDLPELDDDTFVIDPVAACNAQGKGVYSAEIELENGDKLTVSFEVEYDFTDHDLDDESESTFEYTDEDDQTWIYTIKRCNDCGEWVVVDIEAVQD